MTDDEHRLVIGLQTCIDFHQVGKPVGFLRGRHTPGTRIVDVVVVMNDAAFADFPVVFAWTKSRRILFHRLRDAPFL